MISGAYWDLCDDDSIRRIDRAAIRLLTHGGARIEHEGLLKRLESEGCRVDHGARRCRFTENLVRDAVAAVGRNTRMIRAEISTGWDPHPRMRHSGSFPHILEWPSGRRRLATCQDVVEMAKMAQSLDEFVAVGKVLTCSEVDQRIEPLWTNLQIARYCTKPPLSGEVFYADYLDDLVAMGEILTGRKGDTVLIASCDFFVQPLILEHNQAACFVRKRELGLETVPGTMAVAGMSAPVTVAGVVTLSVAELLAGWTLGYLINPQLGASGIVATGTLDMQTMHARFSSPEALLQNIAVANLVRRLYGIEIWPCTTYTDCKTPGIQAAFDKMLGLLAAPFTPSRSIGADGLLSAGQDYSPVQHMIDCEMNTAIGRFWGHFEVTDDTIAADLIERMMQQEQTNFLDTEHTLTYYQTEQWYPRWLDRTPWQGSAAEVASERAMLERIARYCSDAIANYRPPEDLDRSKIVELEKIFQSAERRILGANVTPLRGDTTGGR